MLSEEDIKFGVKVKILNLGNSVLRRKGVKLNDELFIIGSYESIGWRWVRLVREMKPAYSENDYFIVSDVVVPNQDLDLVDDSDWLLREILGI